MSEILRAAKDDGVPDAISRSTFWRDRKQTARTETPYGPLIQIVSLRLNTDVMHDIGVIAPMPLLWALAREDNFARLLLRTHQQTPCTLDAAWTIVLYCDEVSPSNPLASGPDHRKVQAIYWSIAEFGQGVLCSEYVWFVLTAVRSEICAILDGGVSNVIRECLERVFFSSSGHNVETAGMIQTLRVGGVDFSVLIRLQIGTIVADELALKDILCFKGHAGLKPCCCCSRLVLHRSALADSDRRLLTSTSLDFTDMTQHTNASIIAILVRLRDARGTIAKSKYTDLESMLGWNFNPNMMLMSTCTVMKPAEWIMYDWMHVYIVKGIFNSEVGR
jgi:hypothetical protein